MEEEIMGLVVEAAEGVEVGEEMEEMVEEGAAEVVGVVEMEVEGEMLDPQADDL